MDYTQGHNRITKLQMIYAYAYVAEQYVYYKHTSHICVTIWIKNIMQRERVN